MPDILRIRAKWWKMVQQLGNKYPALFKKETTMNDGIERGKGTKEGPRASQKWLLYFTAINEITLPDDTPHEN